MNDRDKLKQEALKQQVLAKCAKVCPNWGDSIELKHGFILKNIFVGKETRWVVSYTNTIGTYSHPIDIIWLGHERESETASIWLLAADLLEGIGDTIGTDQRTGEGC